MPEGPDYLILEDFRIDRLSSVDVPAQEGALAVLMKRRGAGEDLEKHDRDQAPVVMTSAVDGHQHVIYLTGAGGETSYGRGTDEDGGHSHPWILEAGVLVIGEERGHTHEADAGAILGALLAIGKRKFSAEQRKELSEKGLALPDGSYPIVNKGDLRNAISAFGRAKNKGAAAAHIKKRAKALDALDLLPDEGLLAKQAKESDMADKTDLEKAKDEAKDLKAKMARLEKVATLTDSHRVHFGTLDEAGQTAFLEKSADKRDAELVELEKRKTDADPVEYTAADGVAYHKSAGTHVIALAKRGDERDKEIAELRKQRDDQDLRKRAEEQLQYMPGTIETRMELLKSAEGIKDEATRKSAVEGLKAQNAAMAKAFEVSGTSAVGAETPEAGSQAEAEAELEKRAKAYQTEHKVDYYTAYNAVSESDTDLTKRAVGAAPTIN